MIHICLPFVVALALATGLVIGVESPSLSSRAAHDEEDEGDEPDAPKSPAERAIEQRLIEQAIRMISPDASMLDVLAQIESAEDAIARGDTADAAQQLQALESRLYDAKGNTTQAELAARSSVAQGWIAADNGDVASAERFYRRALKDTGFEAALRLGSARGGPDGEVEINFTMRAQMMAARKLALLKEQAGDPVTAEFLRLAVERSEGRSYGASFKEALFGKDKPWRGLRARLRRLEQQRAAQPVAPGNAPAPKMEDQAFDAMKLTSPNGLTPEAERALRKQMEELYRTTGQAIPPDLWGRFDAPELDAQHPELAEQKLREALERHKVPEQFDLALEAFKAGRLRRAEALFQGVIEELSRIGEGRDLPMLPEAQRPTTRGCLLMIARCREASGDTDAAIDIVHKVMEAANAAEMDDALRKVRDVEHLEFLSRLLLRKGNPGQARTAAVDALGVANSLWESVEPEGAAGSIAATMRALPAQPEQEFNRIRDAAATNTVALRALARANAATDPDSAAAHHRLAAEISAALVDTDPIERAVQGVAGAQGGMGFLGPIQQQIAGQFQALGLRTAAECRADLAESLLGLASVMAQRRKDSDLEDAATLLARAIAIARREGHESQYVMETALGNLLIEQGRHRDAMQFFASAMEELQWRRRLLAGEELSRASRMSELRAVADPFEGHVRAVARSVGDGDAAPALRAITMARGQAFRELATRAGVDPAATLAREAARLGDLQLEVEVERIISARAAASKKAAAIEEQLRTGKVPADARSREIGRLLTLQEEELAWTDQLVTLVRRMSLGKPAPRRADFVPARGECLLAYQFGPKESWVVVSSGQGTSVHRLRMPDGTSASSRSVEEIAQRLLRDYAGSKDATPRTVALVAADETALGAMLVPPAVAATLAASDIAVIVADGPVVGLPFEALRLPFGTEDPRRWVDAGPATLYAAAPPTGKSRRTVLPGGEKASLVAIGIENFGVQDSGAKDSGAKDSGAKDSGAKDSGVDAASRSLPAQEIELFGPLTPLPNAVNEVEAIRALWSTWNPRAKVNVLANADARHAAIGRAAQKPTVLHFATHGFSVGGSRIGESCVIVSRAAKGEPDKIRLRELLADWSGRLEGTQLVVLSACETGKGKGETGEGAVALTWGFMHAGAGNVLATRWAADDTASLLLMGRFYENYLGEHDDRRSCGRLSFGRAEAMPPAIALAEARRWLMTLKASQIDRQMESMRAAGAPRTADATRGVVTVSDAPGDSGDDRNAVLSVGPLDHPRHWGLFELTTRPVG